MRHIILALNTVITATFVRYSIFKFNFFLHKWRRGKHKGFLLYLCVVKLPCVYGLGEEGGQGTE